ncbi:FBP1-like protein [Mya arenaria]|uniref:FBP1-like protein n=1 Tax=Mya arenaria TaxID=6604 RepID=A0ABY7DC36_MYAAR|nr:FBP1-like protein [Mya arenaria]
MTFNEASTTCNLEGAHMLYLANEIEYDEVIAHNAPGMNIWMGFETNGTHIGRNVTGFDTPSDRIPRWANNEPAPNMHGVDCILVDYMKGLMVRACDELHPFFCKRRACLKGYMSCDTATKCVREVRKCDGKLDCLDTRDELDCPNDMNYIDVETSGTFSTRTLYSGQQRIWTMKAPIGRRIKLYRFTGTVSAGVYLYSDNNYMTVRLYANNLQQNFDAKTLSYTADNTNIYLGYKDLDATVVLTPLIFPYQGLEYKPEGLHLRRRITAHGGDYITYYVEPIDKTKPTSGKIRGGMTYLEPGDVRVTGRNELHITMEGVPENLQLMYKSGCGDITLMHEYGTIKLFDELIPNNATCTWTLKGGEAVGRGLALKFMNDLYDDPRTTLATKSMDIFTIEGSGGTKTGVENYPEMIYHSSDDCPMLDVSEQTKMNKNTTYFDEDVLLTCPTGYDFHLEKYASRTSLTLRCTKGSWYIDDDKLAAIPECKTTSCNALPDNLVLNGRLEIRGGNTFTGGNADFDTVVQFFCNDGYELVGTVRTHCNASGWTHGTTPPTCQHIDECQAGTSGCDLDSTACRNNVGGRECICKDGFNNPTGETTCSALECPELPGVQNGWYLTSETQFHFNEEVDIHCADGYFFASDGTNTSNTDGKLTCTAAGNWDIIPSCYARECTLPVKPLNGMYDTEKVAFGEQLTLTCNLSESEQISRQAICLYNGTEKGVVFGGDDITVCPEINCGDPDDVMPPAGTYAGNKPPTFTYWQTTSQFTFDCSAGSSVTGQSEDGDVNVKCKANGRWSLNSLGCLGVMCMDPGTPGDANQIASSYEIGATLGYACTRTGFKPTGPENYTCGYINGAAVWSDNLDNVLPTCKADGEQCEDIYHICCGNPCTNGGTCVSGDGPTDYTCTCVTDYDICIMETKAEMMIGNATGQIGYSIVQDKAECEQLCLDDENCIEATFLTSSGGISACRLFNIAAYLKPATIAGTVHMAKHCTSGFTGDNCEVDNIDNCNNSQCHENSRCIDKINGYECICSSSGGFGAVTLQQIPVMIHHANMELAKVLKMFDMNAPAWTDECNAHPDACMYGGTCVDRVNGYQCNCMTGFTGEHCENVPNYCLPGDCQEGNVCYTSLDAHDGVCSCDTRFFEPVFICDMQDTTGTGLGDPVPEVIGGPRIVQSIQECKDLCQYETNCGYAIYQEFPTSKACILYRRGTLNETVNAGSTLIKKDCSTEGTHYNCNRNSIPCDTIACDNNGICSDNGYVAICQCAAGFWGTRCQYSVDDCVNNNCQNGAVCVDGYLDFTCECLEGFEGNQCETNTDDCPGLCTTTQGSCVDLVDGYNCVCKPGYQDSNCELEIDECLSYPCKHGADCEDMVNDYSCMCEEGWTGKNCDTEIDHCKSRTCQNSGQCFNLPESSFCRCEGGALGENCENATLVCDVMSGTDVCQNRDYDVRRCYFDEGRVGIAGGTSETLELVKVQSLDECKTRCLNNPNCSDVVFVTLPKDLYCYLYEREKFVSTSEESTRVHYRRICPTDYTGDSCEQVKDWCSDENNPCENGGECTPKGPVGYTCMCKPGYSGVTCNIDADPCSTTPCAGVAKCQSTMIPQDQSF